MAKQQHVDLSDWMESQSKDYAPSSSLDRYLSQPDSPRWESSELSTSNKLLSPSLMDHLSTQYAKGERVAVRCNRHKWLLGEVKRLSARGIRVWVGEAGLLVNIPKQLLTTHLLKMSSLQGLHSLPPAGPMIVAPPGSTDGPCPVQCVRPAHLSHRQLYLPAAAKSKRNACAICGQAVIVEDDAVAPWDCDHNCHIDCIQDKPRFFSTTTCPVCKEQHSSSYSPSSSSPSSPSPYDHVQHRQDWPVLTDREEPCSLSQKQLHTIDEESHERPTAAPKLKPALKKQSGSPEEPPPPSPPPPGQAPIPSPAAMSLADRMKKFSMWGGCIEPQQEQSVETAWLTVIRNGQNTRQSDSQQRIENMARAKENTFSAKAAKRQQEQQHKF